MDNSNKPLCVILEEAKIEFARAINQASAKTKLPAYLVESVLLGILADVRAQKAVEIVTEMNTSTEPPASLTEEE